MKKIEKKTIDIASILNDSDINDQVLKKVYHKYCPKGKDISLSFAILEKFLHNLFEAVKYEDCVKKSFFIISLFTEFFCQFLYFTEFFCQKNFVDEHQEHKSN